MNISSISSTQNYRRSIRLFLEGGGDPNHRDQFNDTFLHLFAKEREGFSIVELVRAGADVNSANFLEQTPLHIAVMHRNRSMVNALINFGALVNTQDCNGNSVLHTAINACAMDQDWNCGNPFCPHRPPDMDIIRRLLDHKDMEVNIKNSEGCTPLLWAVKDRKLDIVKALLSKSANVNIGDEYLETPLHAALSYRNPDLDIVGELLRYGASITCFDVNHQTPLYRIFKQKEDIEYKAFAKKLVQLVAFYDTKRDLMTAKSGMSADLKEFSKQCFVEINIMKRKYVGDKSLYDLVSQRMNDKTLPPLDRKIVNDVYKILKSVKFWNYNDFILNCISDTAK